MTESGGRGFHAPTLRSASLALLCFLAAALSVGAPARAQPAAAEEDPAPAVVRIALSKRASGAMSEVRVRRLVELQLGPEVTVAPEPLGPLDENAVRVFIDLPEPSVALIQTVAPKRRLASRRVDVAGLPWDAATRFVAIAASQTISLQLRPVPKKKPRAPTPEEIAARLQGTPSFELGGALAAAWLPGDAASLFGSRLRASFHDRYVSESLSVSGLGATHGDAWLDVSLGIAHRTFWLPSVRTHVGAGLGVAAVFAAPPGPGGGPKDADPWLRAHASLGTGLRLVDAAWLSVDVEPGIAVDARRDRVLPWIGAAVAIGYDGALE